ncbi:MAG TPA: type I 3-dehydroquinate dehydratase [Humisphaera sp.]|jgi:3-dehydroquinate dehydratase/shikimate dehydrogenase|nr:type I 3-dehydroquinate dehydratase [Humisphaera sp.]
MTLLCVPIFVHDAQQARREAALAAEAGADIVELRIDEMTEPFSVADFGIPCIVTNRPTWEGGRCELPDEDRLQILAKTAEGAAYADVELETLRRVADVPDKIARQLIVSAHDFQTRPAKLHNLMIAMNESPAAIAKIAWPARTVRDNLEAFEILQRRQKPTIALCMGEAGIISRILAKKFGAFLTFASLEDGIGTAPGQVPIDRMKRLYRWDAIGPQTKVYGVVGSPIAHSISPAIHNAAFDQAGIDGVYVPLLVNEGYESFKAFMERFVPFEGLDLAGLSITIPHKENALRYLIEKGGQIEPLARQIGAVNTIAIDRQNGEVRLSGRSTDYAAILDSITEKLQLKREDLAGFRVAVIGAGGTGRTAVAALAHYGATVVVYNRTRDRAEALATEFNGKSAKVVSAPIEKLCDSCCQIYINTTSLGMHPNIDASAFGDNPPKLTSDQLVFDAVYNPIETKLLKQTEAAGAKTIGGVEMFVRQAAAQFEMWTGKSAPTEVMRRVVVGSLSPST